MPSAPAALEQSREGRAFLQRRIAMAGLFGAVLGFVFLVYRSVEATVNQHWQDFSNPAYLLHVGGVMSMGAMWLICRSGKRPVAVLRGTETGGMLAACVCYSLMGAYIPSWQMPHYLVLLALQGMFVARAIYVPSSGRRTLALTVAAGVPALATIYVMYSAIDVSQWLHFEPELIDATASEVARSVTMSSALWWAATVALCAGASKVIYGLRKEMRDVRKLGQYELVEKLGEGGMGMVYKAEHAMLRRPTAVKLLPLDKAGERSVTRFAKEVQQTARLTHPNTVTIFDYGRTPEGVFYYAMELLAGATLREIVEVDGPQSPARVARVLEHAAGALAEAHGVGLIHRDIKPANIMLVEQGGELDIPKVLDFGLVKELNREISSSLTQADTITGTPQYLSPEGIARPDEVDARSDLYALGAVGYYMLAGSHVFEGNTVVEVCSKHLHTEPQPLSERARDVPKELEALIMRCLSKHPEQRPQSASELAAEVRACRDLGDWTHEDAERWWNKFRGVIRERHMMAADAATGHAMEVDFARRAGLTP
jgi:serine/threonine-protein kinase